MSDAQATGVRAADGAHGVLGAMGPLAMPPRIPIEALEQIAFVDHAEGICVAPDGTVYLSGETGQIHRLDADGSVAQLTTTGGRTLGLACDAEGRVYACDPVRHAVLRWAPGDATPAIWTDGAVGSPLVTPNWGTFGPDGSYYVTDSGTWKRRDGRLLVVRRGVAAVWTRASVDFPNGCAVSPDGRELWVLESTPGALVSIAIGPDGSAGPRRLLADLSGTVPDGLAFATDGSVIIACYRPDVVLRWRADTGVEVLASDPEGGALAAPTNVAFTGPGRDVILVPNIAARTVTRFRVPGLEGVPLFYPSRDQVGS